MFMSRKRKLIRKPLAETVKSGFTIVEFTLATAFIAVLLITVAIITSNIIAIYQKGLTLKAVNSVGRGLTDEFTEAINIAPSVDTTNLCNSHLNDTDADGNNLHDICKKDKANNFIYQQLMAERTTENEGDEDGGDNSYNVQLGGVFCTGKYSYVWNTIYAEELAATERTYLSIKYLSENGTEEKMPVFRLIKVEDPTYRVCSAVTEKTYKPCLTTLSDLEISLNTIDSGCAVKKEPIKSEQEAKKTDGVENVDAYVIDITTLANGRDNRIATPEQGFLSSFDLDLQLYEFAIFPIAQDDVTLRTFMSGTFILATERGNINLTRSGNYCDVNKRTNADDSSNILDVGAEFNYCAINKFNFAARTAGM